MTRILSRIALAPLAALLLFGCEPAIDAPLDPETGVPLLYPEGLEASGPVSVKTAALVQSQSCDEVAGVLRAHAIAERVQQIQQSFVQAWKQKQHCYETPIYLSGGADAGMAMPSAPTSEDGRQDPAHSETNNQVEGVDEADLVKTDGSYIYLVSGSNLRILRSWPAAETEVVATVPLSGTGKKLFLRGDRVLVYASPGGSPRGMGGYGGGECTYGYDCVPTGDGLPTHISVFDVRDRAHPRLVRELKISSSLLAARRIDSAVHTVVTTGPSFDYYSTWPADLEVCKTSRYRIYQAFRQLLLQTIAELQDGLMSSVLPAVDDLVYTDQGTVRHETPLADCTRFLRSNLGDGDQLTSVITLGIDDERPASAVTIVSQPGIVYASRDALFLAEPRAYDGRYGWYEELGEAQEATTIHKFLLGGEAAAARYLGSGLVKGRLLNQFSLDEHQGFLRIASTTGHVGGYGSSAHNTLSVLEEREGGLREVGILDQLAPTEDIRSVRFDGERGYVVTFKKTDPLFVLDLADPRRPRVLGELKIPGFSTYMHKMDDRHLLTIGYDADDQSSFAWFTGVMLQIFDVSDPTRPALKFKHVIGTRGSSSEALTNHLAFTYYAPKQILSLPMTICEGSEGGGSYGTNLTFSGLMVFDVTAETGFALRGKVGFPKTGLSCSTWWTEANSLVKRSLIIEDYVYSLSDKLLKVSALDDLSSDLRSVPLD